MAPPSHQSAPQQYIVRENDYMRDARKRGTGLAAAGISGALLLSACSVGGGDLLDGTGGGEDADGDGELEVRLVVEYAEGDVGPVLSFYFRGPEAGLNLRAQNLIIFTQIAEGLDDETWSYHLRRGDYSRWFREVIKDAELADEAVAHGIKSTAGVVTSAHRSVQ